MDGNQKEEIFLLMPRVLVLALFRDDNEYSQRTRSPDLTLLDYFVQIVFICTILNYTIIISWKQELEKNIEPYSLFRLGNYCRHPGLSMVKHQIYIFLWWWRSITACLYFFRNNEHQLCKTNTYTKIKLYSK